jgi:hypothetical protein
MIGGRRRTVKSDRYSYVSRTSGSLPLEGRAGEGGRGGYT